MSDTDMTTGPGYTQEASTIPSNFLYEDEHPQIQMPFTVKIGDRRMEGKSLSLTQAVVEGLLPPAMEGSIQPATLRFDFDGFSVNLFAETRVIKEGGAGDPAVLLQFAEPAGSHLAPLRYIINSYLAGDMVSMGGMLGYTGPVQVKPAKSAQDRGFGDRVGGYARRGLVIAASVLLVAIAGKGLYDRIVFDYEPRPVALTQMGDTLRATSAGQISYVDPSASEDSVIYSISANSGDFLSVRMPCDCTIEPLENFFEGATVTTGTPIVKLVEQGAPLVAETGMTFEGASRALRGDQAELVFASGDVVPVDLEYLTGMESAAGSDNVVQTRVILPEALPEAANSGAVAQLRLRREILPQPLRGLFDPQSPAGVLE